MGGLQEHTKWEEEEEEEQEVSQLVRQSKSRNGHTMATDLHAPMCPISSSNNGSASNGSDNGVESGSPNGEERKEPDHNHHIADQEDHDISVADSAGSPGSQQDGEFTKLPNSVYFDKNQGLWKCRHCSWTHLIASPVTFHIQNSMGYSDMLMNVKTFGQQGPCFIFEFRGTELTNGKEFGGIECHDDQNLDVKVEKFDFQNSLTTEVNHQIAENSVDEIENFFGLNPSTLEESCEEQNGGLHFDSKSRVEADVNVDVMEEIDQEGTEIDLERVLEKQDTHDLYCPNCNSCITRRVILRRRKRKIRNFRNKQKCEKSKTIIHSELDANPTYVADNNDTVNDCSNGSPTTVAGDRDSETEPDIFRCLSCFSFFIPTGNGFKLFQVSKDGNGNENMLNSQTITGAKTNWFFSIFASNKRDAATEHGDEASDHSRVDRLNQHNSPCFSGNMSPSHVNDHPIAPVAEGSLVNDKESAEDVNIKPQKDVQESQNSLVAESLLPEKSLPVINQQSKMAIRNETLDDQNGLTSSILGVSSLDDATFGGAAPVNSATNAPQGTGNSPNCLIQGLMLICAGEKSDDAMTRNMTNDAVLKDSVVDTTGQLNSSCFRDNLPPQHERVDSAAPDASKTLVNTEEPAEDATSKLQQVGLKFLVSSNCGSSFVEQSLIETEKESNVAIGDDPPVQNGKGLSVKGSSFPTQSFYNAGLVNNGTAESLEARINIVLPSTLSPVLLEDVKTDGAEKPDDAANKKSTGDDVILIVEETYTQNARDITSIESDILLQGRSQIRVDEQQRDEASEGYGLDILKSIVYGGLIESITSLGVVSSAAGAGAATLNIFVLGLANLIGGLIIIGHNLGELKNDPPTSTTPEEEPLLLLQATNQLNEQEDRYQELLGRRGRFPLHAAVAILSFLVFGLVSPVVYGFSFRKGDNRDFKLAAVAGASLACIILLAIGKSYVQKLPKSYVKTVLYYVIIGLMASGVSYIVGDLVSKLLGKLGWFDSSSAFTLTFLETKSAEPGWASY